MAPAAWRPQPAVLSTAPQLSEREREEETRSVLAHAEIHLVIFEPLGLGQTIKACLGLEAALQLVLGSERGPGSPAAAPENVAGEPQTQGVTAAAAGLALGSLGATDGTLLAQPSIVGAALGGWMRGCRHAASLGHKTPQKNPCVQPRDTCAHPFTSRAAGGTPSAAKHEAEAASRAWGRLNSGSPGPRAVCRQLGAAGRAAWAGGWRHAACLPSARGTGQKAWGKYRRFL